MIKYKVTVLFQADWDNLFPVLFSGSQHCYSLVTGNTGVFGFESPQTPADLGPLVRVELLSE